MIPGAPAASDAPGSRRSTASALGVIGAVLGFIAVAAGAFGAHALRGRIDAAMLEVFQTAAHYQLAHSLAVVVVAVTLERRDSRPVKVAGWLFVIGVVLFSGSLFCLSLTGARTWGLVTPFGGMCFLTGWACLAVGWARRSA